MIISNEKRREVANELRKQAAYNSGSLGEWWQRLQEAVTGEVDFADPQETYRAIADLIGPEGPTVAGEERDTRIPYRLGTSDFCKFKNRDEYVHMGDLVAVYTDADDDGALPHFGYLCGVGYRFDGFMRVVTLLTLDRRRSFDVSCDGAFYYAMEVADD